MGKSKTDGDLAVLTERQRGQQRRGLSFSRYERTFVVNKWLIIQLSALFFKPVIDPGVGITENNALPLAIQSARCIGCKNKPYNQQLLNEAEQDMKNSADHGGCYPQRPKAEVDNAHPPRSAEFFISYESRIQ